MLTDRDGNVLAAAAPNAASQHAPYAGVAIDPYSGDAPSDAYPGATYGQPFSSGVVIDNVHIHGFVVGVVVQPCNADGNGDYTKINRCLFYYDQYCVSVGNSQSRNVAIRDCEFDTVHTFITNNKHGAQRGHLDGPIQNIGGSSAWQFADLQSNQSGAVRFEHIYFELQPRFGVLGTNASFNTGVIFEGCTFTGAQDELRYSPASFIDCSSVQSLTFIGCNFTYFGKFLSLVASELPALDVRFMHLCFQCFT